MRISFSYFPPFCKSSQPGAGLKTLFPDSQDTWASLSDNDPALETLMENMWSLVQDAEFVLLRHYSNSVDVFPRLHGRCGNLYIVEELELLPKVQAELGQQDG